MHNPSLAAFPDLVYENILSGLPLTATRNLLLTSKALHSRTTALKPFTIVADFRRALPEVTNFNLIRARLEGVKHARTYLPKGLRLLFKSYSTLYGRSDEDSHEEYISIEIPHPNNNSQRLRLTSTYSGGYVRRYGGTGYHASLLLGLSDDREDFSLVTVQQHPAHDSEIVMNKVDDEAAILLGILEKGNTDAQKWEDRTKKLLKLFSDTMEPIARHLIDVEELLAENEHSNESETLSSSKFSSPYNEQAMPSTMASAIRTLERHHQKPWFKTVLNAMRTEIARVEATSLIRENLPAMWQRLTISSFDAWKQVKGTLPTLDADLPRALEWATKTVNVRELKRNRSYAPEYGMTGGNWNVKFSLSDENNCRFHGFVSRHWERDSDQEFNLDIIPSSADGRTESIRLIRACNGEEVNFAKPAFKALKARLGVSWDDALFARLLVGILGCFSTGYELEVPKVTFEENDIYVRQNDMDEDSESEDDVDEDPESEDDMDSD